MSDIDKIIYDYSRGFHYRRLTFEDFISISSHKILKMASEYGVKPQDYDTSEDDIRSFCGQFTCQVMDDYWSYVNYHKDNQEINRGFVFCLKSATNSHADYYCCQDTLFDDSLATSDVIIYE